MKRSNTCQFGCATRLDIVCLSLADCTVIMVYRLNFFPSFLISPNQTENSDQLSEIQQFFKKKIRPVKSQDLLSKTKSKTLFPTTGNHGSNLSCPLRQSVCCRFLSHTRVREDTLLCRIYASIQCVSVCDGERRNHRD